MLRIGLTGGIGSGKSTVAHIFNVLGIPVYDADAAAKRIMAEDEVLKKSLLNAFGENAYTNGKLNRKFLSEVVFKDENKINLLNSLVHPATIKDANEWMKKQNSPYLIKEAALIFESGSDKFLDKFIGVRSPLSLRIERTMKRNNITAEEVEARIKFQMDEDKKMEFCDFIIENDEKEMLIPQVLLLHETLLQKATE
ncbi:MAG: dephospho-CoA kinase [Ginsengibacter sp.]